MKAGTTSKTDDIRERDIEGNVCGYARDAGFYRRKFTSPSHVGVPDDFLISPGGVLVPKPAPGLPFMIEFKAPGKKPTLLQEMEHAVIRRYGIAVYVVDSVQQGRDIIDSYR